MRNLTRVFLIAIVGIAALASRGETILYSTTFDGDTSDWIGEGPAVSIVDGQLDFNVINSSGTIWLNRKWSGNIKIEYDVLMLGYRDLNVFWMATDPNNPDNFFAADRSSGSFTLYNSLDLYYVGYGGNRNETTRGRKYYDNLRPILVEYTEQPNLLNGENSTYRVRLVQNEGTVEYWIDQKDGLGMQQIWSYDDNTDSDGNGDPYTEGYFGIRGAKTHYRIDNVTVSAIPEPGVISLMGAGMLSLYASRRRLKTRQRGATPRWEACTNVSPRFLDAERDDVALRDVFK